MPNDAHALTYAASAGVLMALWFASAEAKGEHHRETEALALGYAALQKIADAIAGQPVPATARPLPAECWT